MIDTIEKSIYSCLNNYILRGESLSNPKELVHQIFQLSRAMTSHLNKEMAEYNLTHAQFVIIQYLIKNTGSSSLVDIARYLNVEKSSVTRTVNRLKKATISNKCHLKIIAKKELN